MRGMKQVFLFTLKQLIFVKSYRLITLVMALILFLAPAIILPLSQNSAEDTETIYADEEYRTDDETDEQSADAVLPTFIAYVADDGVSLDWCTLFKDGLSGYYDTEWETFRDLGSAEKACEDKAGSAYMILAVSSLGDDSTVSFNTIIPESSICSDTDGETLISAIEVQYEDVLLQNLTAEQKEALENAKTVEIEEETEAGGATSEEEAEETEEEDGGLGALLLSLLLPYLNIMIVYFLVLYYGQNTANSVILEKTSKLMDTMLVSVKPRAMIMGKVAATWAASVIQFLIWIACLAAGLFAGIEISLQINPDSGSTVVIFWHLLCQGLGSTGALKIVLAVVMIMAGYFMYCSLSSISGAIAGKPEELSATNTIFTMVLIISFMGALYSGFMNDTLGTGLTWVDLIPSVAVLITPARLLLGKVPLYGGLISLLIMIVVSVLLTMLSGRIYTMMSMYKGGLPKPKQLFDMLREKGEND